MMSNMTGNRSHNGTRTWMLATVLLAVSACGSSSDSSSQSDSSNASSEQPAGEHFLSEQQKALERSKAAADAMQEAAAKRARQTDAANDS